MIPHLTSGTGTTESMLALYKIKAAVVIAMPSPALELYNLKSLLATKNKWNFTPFNKQHRVPRPMVTTVAMEVMPAGFTITSKITQSYRLPFILTHPATALVQHALHKIKQTT